MDAQVGAARLAPSRPIIITLALITIRVAAVAWWSSRDHYVDESVWCSPTLSLERMHECALRRRHGVGGACRSPRLLAEVGARLWALGPRAGAAVACAGDAATALLLDVVFGGGRRSATACYLLNPALAVAGAAGSLLAWYQCLLVGALALAARGPLVAAGAAVAAAAAVDALPALAALPAVVLFGVRRRRRAAAAVVPIACGVALVALAAAALPSDAPTPTHSSASAAATAAAARTFLGLPPPPTPRAFAAAAAGPFAAGAAATEPNAGPWWYANLVVFSRFAPLLRAVFGVHPVLCAAPVAYRLAAFPTLAAALLLSFGSVFRPEATLADAALPAALAALGYDGFAGVARNALDAADDRAEAERSLRAKLLEAAVFVVAAGAAPAGANVALYLWQVAATGNANFWYFLGLAHSFSWAVLACKALAWFMPHRPSAVAKRKAKPKRD